MSDPRTMTPTQFAEWVTDWHAPAARAAMVAARDAAIKEQALRDAVTRHAAARRDHNKDHQWPWERDAIMGTPPLVKGMIVRYKITGQRFTWDPSIHGVPENYEPVKGHADANGNLIVDEEA